MVYAWTRGRHRAIAVKGMPGHLHPPLGLASKQDVNYMGRRHRSAVLLWPVGTWVLKSELYGNLRRVGPDDTGAYPPGYCHFSTLHDEAFFRQLTAEPLITRERNGRRVTEWVASGPNHALDCRIYTMAAAEHLGMGRWTLDGWRELATARGASRESIQTSLDAMSGQGVGPGPAAPPNVAGPSKGSPGGSNVVVRTSGVRLRGGRVTTRR
jgi:phage terminase large subunit GpA-like protein